MKECGSGTRRFLVAMRLRLCLEGVLIDIRAPEGSEMCNVWGMKELVK